MDHANIIMLLIIGSLNVLAHTIHPSVLLQVYSRKQHQCTVNRVMNNDQNVHYTSKLAAYTDNLCQPQMTFLMRCDLYTRYVFLLLTCTPI